MVYVARSMVWKVRTFVSRELAELISGVNETIETEDTGGSLIVLQHHSAFRIYLTESGLRPF